MRTLNDKRCLHREGPVRTCKQRGCGAYLTTANEDRYCVEHGGWTTQRLKEWSGDVREDRAELLEELISA